MITEETGPNGLPRYKLTLIDFNVARNFRSSSPNVNNGQNKILLKTNTGN